MPKTYPLIEIFIVDWINTVHFFNHPGDNFWNKKPGNKSNTEEEESAPKENIPPSSLWKSHLERTNQEGMGREQMWGMIFWIVFLYRTSDTVSVLNDEWDKLLFSVAKVFYHRQQMITFIFKFAVLDANDAMTGSNWPFT